MKYTSTLLFICFLSFTAHSQEWNFTAHYSLGLPQQQMGSNIQPAHSLQAGVLYQPKKLKNLFMGLELGLGLYAHKKVHQTFMGSVMPVHYNSNVFNANLQTRWHLLDQNRFPVVPYVNAKAGLYNFYSNIVIEDPDDPDGCKPLERKNIMNDKTLYWSAGTGVQVNAGIFSKRKR